MYTVERAELRFWHIVMARCFEEDFALLLRFMTAHIFQLRFADSEKRWMFILTTCCLFVRWFLDFEQLQTRLLRQSLITFQRCRVNNIRVQTLADRH